MEIAIVSGGPNVPGENYYLLVFDLPPTSTQSHPHAMGFLFPTFHGNDSSLRPTLSLSLSFSLLAPRCLTFDTFGFDQSKRLRVAPVSVPPG